MVVRLQPGEDVVLRSLAPDLGVSRLWGRLDGADDTFDVHGTRFLVVGQPGWKTPSSWSPAPY